MIDFHVRLPETTARAFRILAAQRGVKHAELLAQLLEEAK